MMNSTKKSAATGKSAIDKQRLALLLREKALREARRDLLAFTLFTKPDYEVNWHHRLLASKLQELVTGNLRRLIVCMPPQHGKSELVCRRFPAWVLGKNRQTRIIACTHTATLAEAHSRDIQRIIESADYRAVFPDVILPAAERRLAGRFKRTDDYWELPQGGYFRAAGVGGAITGLRFDLGIIDDPIKNREEAESPIYRQKIWEWYTSDFFTRRSREAAIVLCMTRWHKDDLVGRLLRQEDADQWDVIELPALAREDRRHPEDPRTAGEALWPAFLDAEALERTRRQDLRAFAALYQQDPAEAAGTEWPPAYFGDWLWIEEDRWPPPADWWLVAIDPSRGRADLPGDDTAIVAVGVAQDRGLLFVDADIQPRTPEDTIRRALQLYEVYRPRWMVVESNQYHGFLERQLERESLSRLGLRIPVWPIHNTENKLMRIRRIGPYLANRELRFRRNPGCRLLVEELEDFPLAEHDDGPDALEMALRLILQSVVAPPSALERETFRPGSVPEL
ncbi:MAG TPA: phage terminase large subunit [Candidatus Hydrogenedentes bacterium]|nr:phage terminase large subunit [Candidatus Hydrogenedentota bacterium]